MKNLTQNTESRIIVCFHIGRGGRFNNAGHISYVGEYDLNKLIEWASDKLYYKNRDEKGRFCQPYYADCNGGYMISVKEVESGVGSMDWDGQYNTDTCCYLDECSERELNLIEEYSGYKSRELELQLEQLLNK